MLLSSFNAKTQNYRSVWFVVRIQFNSGRVILSPISASIKCKVWHVFCQYFMFLISKESVHIHIYAAFSIYQLHVWFRKIIGIKSDLKCSACIWYNVITKLFVCKLWPLPFHETWFNDSFLRTFRLKSSWVLLDNQASY